MKRILTLLSALLLTILSVSAYAQNTANDYNLKKAYEVLNEEKDEAKALDLVNRMRPSLAGHQPRVKGEQA